VTPSAGFSSPYYTETHKKFRAKVRAYVEKELMPNIHGRRLIFQNVIKI